MKILQEPDAKSNKKHPVRGVFHLWRMGRGLAAADLAKFAAANRHTAVCLFAAVRTPARGFSSHPTPTRDNKKCPEWDIFYSWRCGKIVRFITYNREFTGKYILVSLCFKDNSLLTIIKGDQKNSDFF